MSLPNLLVKLDYDPDTFVLFIEWPDFTLCFYSEFQLTMDIIITKIRNTNAKYLLSDTRNANIEISEHKYRAFNHEFAKNLTRTRIEKIARVVTDDTIREQLMREITEKVGLQIPVRNFYSEEEALQWLTSNQTCPGS